MSAERFEKYQETLSYRICVIGHIPETPPAPYSGMTITFDATTEGEPITTFVGSFEGQPALLGLLKILHDWNLTLLEIERL